MADPAEAAAALRERSVASGFSDDRLLGGRVKLRQPGAGDRAAIDPVLLAAAVPAGPGDRVLEVGAGAGAAMLCLARRVPDCRVVGLELQAALVALAAANIAANGVGDRVEIVAGDLLRGSAGLPAEGFDHVMANPPHLTETYGTPPAAGRQLSRRERAGGADLDAWVRFGLALLRPKGSLTLVHRADRIDDLLAALRGKAGGIVVFPLWPRRGQPAKRVILRARMGVATPTRLAPGLVLHGSAGKYTRAAEAVLRMGRELEL